MTDNAANMAVVAREMGVPHVSCFAHTLQLAIEECLKLAPLAKALGRPEKSGGMIVHQ